LMSTQGKFPAAYATKVVPCLSGRILKWTRQFRRFTLCEPEHAASVKRHNRFMLEKSMGTVAWSLLSRSRRSHMVSTVTFRGPRSLKTESLFKERGVQGPPVVTGGPHVVHSVDYPVPPKFWRHRYLGANYPPKGEHYPDVEGVGWLDRTDCITCGRYARAFEFVTGSMGRCHGYPRPPPQPLPREPSPIPSDEELGEIVTLMYAGRFLPDDMTLEELGIGEGATLFAISHSY